MEKDIRRTLKDLLDFAESMTRMIERCQRTMAPAAAEHERIFDSHDESAYIPGREEAAMAPYGSPKYNASFGPDVKRPICHVDAVAGDAAATAPEPGAVAIAEEARKALEEAMTAISNTDGFLIRLYDEDEGPELGFVDERGEPAYAAGVKRAAPAPGSAALYRQVKEKLEDFQSRCAEHAEEADAVFVEVGPRRADALLAAAGATRLFKKCRDTLARLYSACGGLEMMLNDLSGYYEPAPRE